MREYHIHHSTNKKTRFQEIEIQPRTYVGCVKAISLEDAFKKSQNFEEPWNETNPCRSTSVGDVIQDNGNFYMVTSMGFIPLETEHKLEK